MGKRNSAAAVTAPSRSSIPPPRLHHQTPSSDANGDDYSSCRQLTVFKTATALAVTYRRRRRFCLPSGWTVKQVLRNDGSRFDRYYYEPGTGMKFRSMIDVQRYINGEDVSGSRSRGSNMCDRSQANSHRKMIVYGGEMLLMDKEQNANTNPLAIMPSEQTLNENSLAIVPSGSPVTMPYNLPDGWIVEEVPRSTGNMVDKYYYEPGTGRKFRSRLAVERHLAELSEQMSLSQALEELNEKRPLSKMFKLHQQTARNSSPWKKKTSGGDSLWVPPAKVNWVIASPRGDSWNAFIGDTLVSDEVRQQWSQRFKFAMNDNDASA